ncbi:MAG TPA: hypothetical protein VGA13_05215 [Acidimicrobiales bacterium]|jgi:hypothetical protein
MWSRDEIDREFAAYQDRAADAGRTGDWRAWADQFTEDCTYVEHHYGTMHGRQAVYEWITGVMGDGLFREMTEFPIDWYVIDEDRGWVICWVLNRFADPGDGSVHEAGNVTILHYAGDGMWSYEEDVYNPASFAEMVDGYVAAKAAAAR